jgi:glycosyltransferase involved in cell wall biosynthesis
VRTAIFIPAYNAATKLIGTLDGIPAQVLAQVESILLVDNASTDGTAQVAREWANARGENKLSVIRNARNLGYGGSQKLAYRHLAAAGFDAVVMLHADGQYAPALIPCLLEPLERGEADMVFGSRLAGEPLKGNMPLHRYLGNKFLTGLANLVLGWRLSEFHSGFRAYRCDALARLPLERCADYYQFDVEVLIQLKVAGLRVVERPIPTHYGDEPNYINVWYTGLAILWILGEYVLHRLKLRHAPKYELVHELPTQ